MDDFRQNFLNELTEPLAKLNRRISNEFTREVRLDAFRLIHTVKGTSRTFGLPQIALIAADLEALLADGEADDRQRVTIVEQLGRLIEMLADPKIEPMTRSRPSNVHFNSGPNLFFSRLRAEIFKQLSTTEKSAFFSALTDGRDIFAVRDSVRLDAFAEEFAALRHRFSRDGEVIAVLPNTNDQEGPERICFGLILSCPSGVGPTGCAAEDLNVRSPESSCFELFSGIAEHVERLRKEAAKTVRLDILADDLALRGRSRQIFEILLHLTSNAVDHGIPESGRIEVAFLRGASGCELSVADDGVGIGDASTGIVFEPGFTTLSAPAANSGRGVGLFAVKSAVAELNGKISLISRKDFGTRFEITLPE